MPKAGTFYVTGVKEILAELKTLEARVAKKLVRPVLRKSLKPLPKKIAAAAPIGETGELANPDNIKIRAAGRSRKRIGINVGYGSQDWQGKQWYAAAQEFGTSKMQGKGYVRKVFDENKLSIGKFIVTELGKAILKEANRNN